MGNTIRRQPITFNIPKEPDYQFLNVLDFRGLKLTDNPFTADSNTASDALNVYVDEANALATRPRLELFLSKFSDMTSVYNIYNIKDGFLVHYLKGSVPSIDIILSEGFVRKSITGTIPTGTKLSVFEQNDIIYVLDGNKYYNIINYVSSEVDGYIPTTRVGMTNENNGAIYEDLNLLTDKYKETYFWDGTWDPSSLINEQSDSVTNDYLSDEMLTSSPYIVLKVVKDSGNSREVLAKRVQDSAFGFLTIYSTGSFGEFSEINIPSVVGNFDVFIDCSSDYNTLSLLYTNSTTGASDKGYLYVGNRSLDGSYSWSVINTGDDYFYENKFGTLNNLKYSRIKMSYDGNLIATYSTTNILLCVRDVDTNTFSVIREGLDNSSLYLEDLGIVGSSDLKVFTVCFNTPSNYELSQKYEYRYKNVSTSTTTLSSEPLIRGRSGDSYTTLISEEGNLYIKIIYDHYLLFENYLSSDDYKEIVLDSVVFKDSRYTLSSDSSRIWLLRSESSSAHYSVDWINLSDPSHVIRNILEGEIGEYTDDPFYDLVYPGTIGYGNSDYLIFTSTRFNGYNYINYVTLHQIFFDSASIEPKISVLRTLSPESDDYLDWNERRDKFLKSFLTTRFNNERWFASGSRLYYTSNNDPSYIGLFNYNDLGESDEDITGFNLAEDTLLIVYKDTRVHSVQYTAVGDEIYTYVYSDSQNVVGNNAIGASIVTALTEVPIQISYDGIYALTQLKNVQSSTRISQSISEDIDKKWLKENKNSIKHALTMNRLYWTYVILDEVDSAGDPIFSKVYLLDNRHNSWFYWEFPIRIINAFSKNNTTHFIGSNGNIYVLRTTDIINEYNPDLLEYYDLDKQVIKWKWKSQILPMKTINYSKKLITTTFILSDTDENDEYGLQYKFKAFRKMASETQETTLTNRINYVVSTTKRTLIPRYNFMQLELSNIEDDLNNNKLRLIGLGFKYVLLEGML